MNAQRVTQSAAGLVVLGLLLGLVAGIAACSEKADPRGQATSRPRVDELADVLRFHGAYVNKVERIQTGVDKAAFLLRRAIRSYEARSILDQAEYEELVDSLDAEYSVVRTEVEPLEADAAYEAAFRQIASLR